MPTKPRSHITEPTSIKVPGSTSGIITIIDTEGRHHVECDLCHSDITLTVTAHPRFFYDHRGHAGCLHARRRQGLPDPIACSLAAPPIPYIMVTPSPAQSSGLERIQCPGLDVTWTPGSIWETYPYHQHHKNPNVLPYRDQSGALSIWSEFKVSTTHRNHQENQLSSSRTFLCIFS